MSKPNYSSTLLVVGGTAVVVALGTSALLRGKERKDGDQQKLRQEPPISTWRVSETLVKADPAELNFPEEKREHREPISEVDEWLCRSSHWLSFCYRFDSVLQENQVQDGLQRTLAHIPALGARVDRTSNPTQYEFVLTPEKQGVVLEVFHGSVVDPTITSLPDESSPREVWQQAGLDAPPAGFSDEPGPDDPMMRARLIVFQSEGVSFLSIGISHGLGDGRSITDILQTWSYFCTPGSTTSGLPEKLRAPRLFGQRVTQAMRPAKDLADLEERVKSDVGCEVNPLSKWAFFGHLLPRAIWTLSSQQVLELRISAERMAALKSAVMKKVPDGEWVSRFEVLCAVMIVAQRATAGDRPLASDHNLHVGTNLRRRLSRFPENYFGNAAFDFCKPLRLPEMTTWDLPSITRVAREIHRAIRDSLANPEDITKTKDWFEAARHLGLRNKYDVWPIMFDTLKGTGTFVNSWDSNWLQISMGAEHQARAFQAYFGMAGNLIVEVPRDRKSGDTTVHLALPPKHAERFVEFCQPGGDGVINPSIPFTIVPKV